ncbi:hypothetical protein Bbelb_306790 [Branchiostoma belcheri]|nr:hypothetical protein Bbelb_306790 [Branchiostoma belcheri]
MNWPDREGQSFSACVSGAQKNLVLVGGNLQEDNAEVYNLIVELAGGRGNAKIGLVTAANLDPENSAQYYKDMFQGRYGAAEATRIPVDIYRKENNSDPEVVALINGMTGFFFGGGDQIHVIESFYVGDRQESPALAAIRAKFEAGAVVSVFVGLSYNALADGTSDYYDPNSPDDVAYNRSGGIGLAPEFVVDVHFSEKGREGRLIRLLADTRDEPNGATVGVGVDENTALHLTWDTEPDSAVGTVVGTGGVMMVDISSAAVSPSRDFDVTDVVTSYLTEDDRVDFATKQVTFAPWKQGLSGNERFDRAASSDDIFGSPHTPLRLSREWQRVATSLFDSRLDKSAFGRTFEKNPQFQVVMSKDVPGAEAAGGNSATTGNYVISYKGMTVRIHPYDATSVAGRSAGTCPLIGQEVFSRDGGKCIKPPEVRTAEKDFITSSLQKRNQKKFKMKPTLFDRHMCGPYTRIAPTVLPKVPPRKKLQQQPTAVFKPPAGELNSLSLAQITPELLRTVLYGRWQGKSGETRAVSPREGRVPSPDHHHHRAQADQVGWVRHVYGGNGSRKRRSGFVVTSGTSLVKIGANFSKQSKDAPHPRRLRSGEPPEVITRQETHLSLRFPGRMRTTVVRQTRQSSGDNRRQCRVRLGRPSR